MTEIVETQHGVSLSKKERERQRQRFLVNLRSLNSFQRRRRVFGNGGEGGSPSRKQKTYIHLLCKLENGLCVACCCLNIL